MKTMIEPKLSKLKVNLGASEETPCFTALLSYAGKIWSISNQGRGGANDYFPAMPYEIMEQLDRWAAANNPPCGIEGLPPLPMNFETWTFTKAFEYAS